MRVLMVTDVFSPRVNGVSTSIDTLRRTLRSFGVEVSLIAPRYGSEQDEDGLTRIDGRPLFGDQEDRLVSWRQMHFAVREAACNCDVVHIQTPFVAHYAGLSAARSLHVPVLTTYHTLFEEYLQYYVPILPASCLRSIARHFSRRQCNAMDAVIVPSSSMQRRLASYGVRVPLHVIPTGVRLRSFRGGQGAAFRRRHGIADDRPVGLYVGRVAHEKNIRFLLDAWARAKTERPELLLLIVGDGPALSTLKQHAQMLGLLESVLFLGYLNRDDQLPDCYAAADVFVFTSLTETQGLVIVEAMASGLPVIAISEMGTTDILGPGRGCLTPPPKVDEFAGAVLHFFSSAPLRRRLREEAFSVACNWSDEIWARHLADLYRRLLRRRD